MASKFEIMLRKYFKRYHQRAMSLKEDDRIKNICRFFEFLEGETKNNMATVMKAKAEWPKRLHYF